MMTRKDYIAVANIFRGYREAMPVDAYSRLINEVAEYMYADNPRFQKAKFIEACGVRLTYVEVPF